MSNASRPCRERTTSVASTGKCLCAVRQRVDRSNTPEKEIAREKRHGSPFSLISSLLPRSCVFRGDCSLTIGLSFRSLTAKTTPELFIPRRRYLLPRFLSSYQNVITNQRRAMCVYVLYISKPCSTLLFPAVTRKTENACACCAKKRANPRKENKGV